MCPAVVPTLGLNSDFWKQLTHLHKTCMNVVPFEVTLLLLFRLSVHSEGEWYLDMPCPTIYNLILAPKPLDSLLKKSYNILSL
jgi:hypothetical protein